MTVNDNDRELHMFLFQKALLMCKDKEVKNRLTKTNALNQKKKKAGFLQLKGFVATDRIVNVLNKSQPGTYNRLMAASIANTKFRCMGSYGRIQEL